MVNIYKATIFVIIILLLFCCKDFKNKTGNYDSQITITDDTDKTINLKKPAKRIISLYSAHTDNLYELGLKDSIIGIYKNDELPDINKNIEKLDYRGDPEKIIAMQPDLVFIRPFINRGYPDFVKSLENAGITIVSLYPESFNDFDDYIMKLAKLTGKEKKAAILLKEFHKTIDGIYDSVKNINPKANVFFESTKNNLRTVTGDSLAGYAIKFAGGVNIAESVNPIKKDSSIASYGQEKILYNADRIDIYIAQKGVMNPGISLNEIINRPGFSVIKAVKNKRVYIIEESIISRPTFRYAQGIKKMAGFFYPDLDIK